MAVQVVVELKHILMALMAAVLLFLSITMKQVHGLAIKHMNMESMSKLLLQEIYQHQLGIRIRITAKAVMLVKAVLAEAVLDLQIVSIRAILIQLLPKRTRRYI